MAQFEDNVQTQDSHITSSLSQIKVYLETNISNLTNQLHERDTEIAALKEQLRNTQHLIEGNQQLINKFIGEISKLQNDIEWYKKTYEKRSFLGTIKEKIFTKRRTTKSLNKF